jgi:FlaA1/EpsC-like NDP-sugar epimerase
MASQRSASRILLNAALDGALAAAAAPLARYIADPRSGLLHPLWFVAGGFITLLLGGLPFRLSQQYWRFAGISDLMGVVGGAIAGAALFSALLLATGFHLPTVTFPLVHAFTLATLLAAPRVAYRLYHGRSRVAGDDPGLQNALLIGAGDAADGFLRALAPQRTALLRVNGLLSLTERQTGRRMHGLPILGAVTDAASVLSRLRARGKLPHVLVVTEPDFLGTPLAALIEAAEAEGVAVRRAPPPTTLVDADRLTLKPVSIEDLLNREQVTLDHAGMARLIGGSRAVVTGAGGSIGSELARQVAALAPAELWLLDSSEYALWQIDLELSESYPLVHRRAVLADVRDAPRIGEIFSELRPELVFHAAALKHVPMVEANPLEGLLTNAFGTRVVADAARAAGALATVFISTDKAVNPTSLMGASKRLAEMYCQALDIDARAQARDVEGRAKALDVDGRAQALDVDARAKALDVDGRAKALDVDGRAKARHMRCVTVRFGNVLGSTGSVVPLFRRQLERGGPITVTHPDMQRYFMTVHEAVALVLQASVVGLGEGLLPGAEEGGIFVLDMGEPVRILDLARQMIQLAGLRPEQDIEIRFTGLRPGEKLFEELFHGREPPVPTGHPGLLMAMPRTSDATVVGRAIDAIAGLCRHGDADAALKLLRQQVPEFSKEARPGLCPGPAGAGAPDPVYLCSESGIDG